MKTLPENRVAFTLPERTSMTKKEQADLRTLIRDTARVAKADAKRRSAILRSDVEEKLSRRFEMDDLRWSHISEQVQERMKEWNAEIAAICDAEGVPKEGQPHWELGWSERGSYWRAERRNEIRRTASAKIEALERVAVESIERHSLEVQTRLIAGQLETEDAKTFLASLPSVENLMPALEFGGDYKLLTASSTL